MSDVFDIDVVNKIVNVIALLTESLFINGLTLRKYIYSKLNNYINNLSLVELVCLRNEFPLSQCFDKCRVDLLLDYNYDVGRIEIDLVCRYVGFNVVKILEFDSCIVNDMLFKSHDNSLTQTMLIDGEHIVKALDNDIFKKFEKKICNKHDEYTREVVLEFLNFLKLFRDVYISISKPSNIHLITVNKFGQVGKANDQSIVKTLHQELKFATVFQVDCEARQELMRIPRYVYLYIVSIDDVKKCTTVEFCINSLPSYSNTWSTWRKEILVKFLQPLNKEKQLSCDEIVELINKVYEMSLKFYTTSTILHQMLTSK